MANRELGRRRVVVPTSGQRPAVRQPGKPDWTSSVLVDTAIVVGTMLAMTLLLLIISGQVQDTTTANLTSTVAPPLLIPSPTPESSALSHPVPSPTPASAVKAPAPTPTPAEQSTEVTDAEIQAAVDKKLQDDPALADSNITATVTRGNLTLVGTVSSDDLKAKVERLVRTAKGVKHVDNQIVVVTNDETPTE